jgi:hypothetical protein
VARCALEASDSGEVRIAKILGIIAACKFGVHDISRTELGPKTKLPRFNMPLELGLFLGAEAFSRRNPRQKVCLIFDRQPYRYQKFCSDIAGQDVETHGGQPKRAIKAVRDWLQANHRSVIRPDRTTIHRQYRKFVQACRSCAVRPNSTTMDPPLSTMSPCSRASWSRTTGQRNAAPDGEAPVKGRSATFVKGRVATSLRASCYTPFQDG